VIISFQPDHNCNAAVRVQHVDREDIRRRATTWFYVNIFAISRFILETLFVSQVPCGLLVYGRQRIAVANYCTVEMRVCISAGDTQYFNRSTCRVDKCRVYTYHYIRGCLRFLFNQVATSWPRTTRPIYIYCKYTYSRTPPVLLTKQFPSGYIYQNMYRSGISDKYNIMFELKTLSLNLN